MTQAQGAPTQALLWDDQRGAARHSPHVLAPKLDGLVRGAAHGAEDGLERSALRDQLLKPRGPPLLLHHAVEGGGLGQKREVECKWNVSSRGGSSGCQRRREGPEVGGSTAGGAGAARVVRWRRRAAASMRAACHEMHALTRSTALNSRRLPAMVGQPPRMCHSRPPPSPSHRARRAAAGGGRARRRQHPARIPTLHRPRQSRHQHLRQPARRLPRGQRRCRCASPACAAAARHRPAPRRCAPSAAAASLPRCTWPLPPAAARDGGPACGATGKQRGAVAWRSGGWRRWRLVAGGGAWRGRRRPPECHQRTWGSGKALPAGAPPIQGGTTRWRRIEHSRSAAMSQRFGGFRECAQEGGRAGSATARSTEPCAVLRPPDAC